MRQGLSWSKHECSIQKRQGLFPWFIQRHVCCQNSPGLVMGQQLRMCGDPLRTSDPFGAIPESPPWPAQGLFLIIQWGDGYKCYVWPCFLSHKASADVGMGHISHVDPPHHHHLLFLMRASVSCLICIDPKIDKSGWRDCL